MCTSNPKCEKDCKYRNSHYKLLGALQDTIRELSDFLAAIADQDIAPQFIDDSCNMISQGVTAVKAARGVIADATE